VPRRAFLGKVVPHEATRWEDRGHEIDRVSATAADVGDLDARPQAIHQAIDER
jgi:hypothetical protein